jgi:ribosomal protein L11 methylase PrmA
MLYVLWMLLLILLASDVVLLWYNIYTRILEPGAVYYTTTNNCVSKMLKLAQITPKDTLVDLGSGDGRIVMAAASRGVKAIGYEINPILVYKSRQRIKNAGLEKLATIYWKSFWKADFGGATVITVYLVPQLMKRLWNILNKRINHPIRIVSNNYAFPSLPSTKNIDSIFLYRINK